MHQYTPKFAFHIPPLPHLKKKTGLGLGTKANNQNNNKEIKNCGLLFCEHTVLVFPS